MQAVAQEIPRCQILSDRIHLTRDARRWILKRSFCGRQWMSSQTPLVAAVSSASAADRNKRIEEETNAGSTQKASGRGIAGRQILPASGGVSWVGFRSDPSCPFHRIRRVGACRLESFPLPGGQPVHHSIEPDLPGGSRVRSDGAAHGSGDHLHAGSGHGCSQRDGRLSGGYRHRTGGSVPGRHRLSPDSGGDRSSLHHAGIRAARRADHGRGFGDCRDHRHDLQERRQALRHQPRQRPALHHRPDHGGGHPHRHGGSDASWRGHHFRWNRPALALDQSWAGRRTLSCGPGDHARFRIRPTSVPGHGRTDRPGPWAQASRGKPVDRPSL